MLELQLGLKVRVRGRFGAWRDYAGFSVKSLFSSSLSTLPMVFLGNVSTRRISLGHFQL